MGSRARIFVVFLVIILLAGIIGTLYYFYKVDKTDISQNVTRNAIYLRIFDNSTQKQIKTGYAVYYPNINVVEKGESISSGFLKAEIISNESLYLMTYNLGNQSFYATLWNPEPKILIEDYQVDLYVHPYGSLQINQQTQLANGKQVNLSIQNNGYLPDLIPCLRWSANFITVRIKDLQNHETPKHLFNKVDRCFSPVNPNSNISIDYDYFGSLDEKEFIKVYFVDTDITKESIPDRTANTADGFDLGNIDIIYEVI